MPYHIIIPAIFIVFALAEIAQSRFFNQPTGHKSDKWVETIGSTVLVAFTQPAILFLSAYIAHQYAPDLQDILADSPLLLKLILLLIFEDMMQYWWHRASHSFPFLYGLHRAHHNGAYMSIRIVYRNNILYYVFMPTLWLTGLLVYMGLGSVYAFYIVVKMSVIYGAHSNVRWDEKLYKIMWIRPLMWLVERTISTPATHAAHHGKYATDPATFYKGNFGNLLFFWDILFGTAKITRQYPEEYGVENLAPMSAKAQLLWPLLTDSTSPTEEITTSRSSNHIQVKK